jgi:DNA-binding transcriptional LysR family regulator
MIRESKTVRARTVRVGVDSIVANVIAASVMPRFIEAFPHTRVEFDVATGTLSEAMVCLSSGEWDFGVVLTSRSSSIPPAYTARTCAQLTTGPHARRGHPLAGRREEVPLAELAAQRWALSTRTDGRALIAACAKRGLDRPDIVARTNSFEALMKLIETTDCVTFLPSEILQYAQDVRLAPLPNSELRFNTSVVVLQSNDTEVTPPARALTILVTECLQALS